QVENARDYVIPFIEQKLQLASGMRVLEVGCGEGGVLKPFFDLGLVTLGVDLDQPRLDLAEDFLSNEISTGKMVFLNQNILEKSFTDQYSGHFDLIILKDVIEHIHGQETFIPFLGTLLRPGGQIFFGFPPWYMPFGGHQQIAKGKWTSKLPWYHLLPMSWYVAILKWGGEGQHAVDSLIDVKQTGISIERFERICKQSGFRIIERQWFLINPIYRFKFGLKPRKQFYLLGLIPFFRNFWTTCAYYTIGK
ncbi:MAG: methyltransferase domain-containing protein, partial [Chitinophagaceae bacterium]|nr:methyltransferase domain-containing protein [Chitinophagaceae bacterium]